MRKILIGIFMMIGLAACQPYYDYSPSPYNPSQVLAVEPQVSYVATGFPHAGFEPTVTGYRITYVRNGVVRTTYSKTPYGVGDIFFN